MIRTIRLLGINGDVAANNGCNFTIIINGTRFTYTVNTSSPQIDNEVVDILNGLVASINGSGYIASVSGRDLIIEHSSFFTLHTEDPGLNALRFEQCGIDWFVLSSSYIDSLSNSLESNYKNIRDLIGNVCYVNPNNNNELHIHRTTSGDFTIISVYTIRFDSRRTFVYTREVALHNTPIPYCGEIPL